MPGGDSRRDKHKLVSTGQRQIVLDGRNSNTNRMNKHKLLIVKIRVVVVFAVCRCEELSGEIAVAHVIHAM